MATPKKKPAATAASQSAKSHQKDLAKMSGDSAMSRSLAEQRKKVASGKKDYVSLDEAGYKGYLGEKKTAKSFATAKPKPADKKNAVEKLVQDVTNRYRVTAREARDIITAAGTVAKSLTRAENPNMPNEPKKKAVGNLIKQVKEVGTAAVTGKKGTTSGRIVIGNESGRPKGVTKGVKR